MLLLILFLLLLKRALGGGGNGGGYLVNFFSHTWPVPPCLSLSVCIDFGGWVISVNSYFLPVVCVCAFFFHTCYTAPRLLYMLRKDNNMYLKSPIPLSFFLSVCLSQSLFGLLVGLLVWVSEREREAYLT